MPSIKSALDELKGEVGKYKNLKDALLEIIILAECRKMKIGALGLSYKNLETIESFYNEIK